MVKVKNLLRIFKTREEYDEVKCELHEKSVSNVHENGENDIEYKYENYFIGTYNVTSTTSVTNIFYYNFPISQVSKMYIDDVEIEPTSLYTFSTIGEHTVKCEFCELTNCSSMFYSCSGLTSIDLSGLDTSNVTDMNSMFYGCRSLTSIDLTPLNTSNVTDMNSMFSGCDRLTSLDLTPLNTSNVTDMCGMFFSCDKLTSIDLSGLDTSNVTNMIAMFRYCPSLTSLDLSGLDTSNVTDMRLIFAECNKLTSIDLSGLDTSKVTDMSSMFYDCISLTSLDLSDLDTSNVTNMSQMFYRCSGLTSIDLSYLDTSNVTNMSNMFYRCYSLTFIDLNDLDTSNVTNMGSIFYDCRSLTSIDLSYLDTSNVTDMRNMFRGCSGLTSLDLTPLNTSNVTDMNSMFSNCTTLTSLDVSNFDTSNVTDMGGMFGTCSGLTSLDVSNFDTSNVTNMGSMFYDCRRLTSLDLSDLDTSNVTNMNYMFYSCSGLISLKMMGDISKVTYYSNMFSGITTNGELTYNCDYEDAWNNILVTNQSTSKFPSTWTKKCVVEYDFVDLGLPSGTQWATFNVGATKPEEYGLYFAWGETEGYSGVTSSKKFKWTDYKFTIDASSSNFSKYNSTDGKTTLEQDDDAAYVSDNTCRMPTSGECAELITNTTSAWTSVNGVNGVQLTSTKDTSKSIFIPAAGGVLNGSLFDVGSYVYILSSTIYPNNYLNAYHLYFNSSNVNLSASSRCYGFSVRPVKGIGSHGGNLLV